MSGEVREKTPRGREETRLARSRQQGLEDARREDLVAWAFRRPMMLRGDVGLEDRERRTHVHRVAWAGHVDERRRGLLREIELVARELLAQVLPGAVRRSSDVERRARAEKHVAAHRQRNPLERG